MKQLLQSLKDGSTTILDVPAPQVPSGGALIKTTLSLVSAGTERMLVDFGKSSLLQKAKSQPDKVKMVMDKAKTDGIAATYATIQAKLEQPIKLGYCNVGIILRSTVDELSQGDRVVSNGSHAEFVAVKKNLIAKIPDNVADEQAVFTVLASIGLQGIRLASPSLGERVVVIGLGLIGLLTVQMLRANGCQVMGIDYDPVRLRLAKKFGAETLDLSGEKDVISAALEFSNGIGVDAVLITAATKSNDPVSQAAKMSRPRGRIVLVGVVGLQINRTEFYEKELTFQVSCSYGPGRYDESYESDGIDYPIGHVRWTEKRNFEAVLDMMANGAIETSSLITHRFQIENGDDAMETLHADKASLAILLNYEASNNNHDYPKTKSTIADAASIVSAGTCSVGLIGSGNYANRFLIPALKKTRAKLHTVVSEGGISAFLSGKKFGFKYASTNIDDVFSENDLDTVFISTRHDKHAEQVILGMASKKHVFCEKPLCLTMDELSKIEALKNQNFDKLIMVGFNRRFSPFIVKMKSLLQENPFPKVIMITVNAGHINKQHWIQNPQVGGGRLVGEACHFIDLARFIADSAIVNFDIIRPHKNAALDDTRDTFLLQLKFDDGSIATINYLSNGDKSFPKERVEVFCDGKILQLDNFKILRGWGWRHFRTMRTISQRKGQFECVESFVNAIVFGTSAPIPFNEIIEVSRVSIDASDALKY